MQLNIGRQALVVAVMLILLSACAKPDWIEQTLVTVDVTGTWQGYQAGPLGQGGFYELFLEQEGPKVKGSIRRAGAVQGLIISGPIEGTVAGDVFRFGQTNGTLKGEMTVSGDEMVGEVLTNTVNKL